MSKKQQVKPSPVRAREEPRTQHPTPGQMEALKAFAVLLDKLGRAPNRRELSAAMKLSESGAQTHLVQLTLKGFLEEEKELVVVGRKLTPLGKQWLKLLDKS